MTTEHNIIDFSAKPFDKHTSTISMPVLRFNFSSTMKNKLSTFAKIHEHDNRFDFKNAWKLWAEQNKLIIHTETERLELLGFTGNVYNKMFKSVRYYFRHKSVIPTAQPPRKTYECMHKHILSAIDLHIISLIQNITMDTTVSPAYAFDRFCNEQINLIRDDIRISYSTDTNSISRDMVNSYINKLKKTYKNRFYNIRVSCIAKT